MTFDAPAQSDYAGMLSTKRFLYMPSCVIVERMTQLYSGIFSIAQTGVVSGAAPLIIDMMEALREDLRVTSCMYRQPRMHFFYLDWREEKVRARRAFHNTMAQLRYVARMIGHGERKELYRAVEGLAAEWMELDRTLDAKAAKRGGHTVCRNFRHKSPENWAQKMAGILLTIDEDDESREGDGLILLCSGKVKRSLVAAASGIAQRLGKKFDPDRILVVSDEDCGCSCPTCLEMADSLGAQAPDGPYPTSLYAESILLLKGAACAFTPRRAPSDTVARAQTAKPKRRKGTTIQWIRRAMGWDGRKNPL